MAGTLEHGGSSAGFFGTTPISQPADIGALTLTTHSGSPDTTLTDVSGSGADATINDNFNEVGGHVNNIRTVLRNLGLMA